MDELTFNSNPLLFGVDPTPGIVAAELSGRFIRLFIRNGHSVTFSDDPFHPFILLESERLLHGFPHPVHTWPLDGEAPLRFMATFDSWQHTLAARDFLAKRSSKGASAADAPYLFLNDPIHQHLLRTGKTFGKGIPFTSLHRLALDIETASQPGFDFSNPEREEDRIISVAIVDSLGFSRVISGHDRSEAELISELTALIQTRDPDVIEGHNLFRFDLEYLRIRSARLGLTLPWGRNGSEPRVHHSRFTIAERSIDYPRWDIFGRQVVDTFFLVQIYDIATRELESLGLKAAARHFNLAAPDRTYLEGSDIGRAFREEPEALSRYNLDDARETLALGAHLGYPFFLQSRIFPYSLQNSIVRGNATKINALFLREYLRQGRSIPRPSPAAPFEGGYTATFFHGVAGPILHWDVASLYPSIMLVHKLAPRQDHLGIFLPMLRDLRRFRLNAKKRARSETDPGQRDYYEALQQTFKVLINSFYGYLGTSLHHFADQQVAAQVTRFGRETITGILHWLQRAGAKPVELDTDGIFFIPPPGITTMTAEEKLLTELAATLPEGIEVELAGRYRSIFSHKAKNYALLGYDGSLTLRGSGLRSRGVERYLRQFLKEMLRLLLEERREEIPQLYADYCQKLANHAFPIEWLAKSETLSETPASYREKVQQGQRNPSAAYEIALASNRSYRAGDQIAYYVTGSGKNVTLYEQCRPASEYDPGHPDENVVYYLEKLRLLQEKFLPSEENEPTLFS
ncbi:MAG TPA: DNA polymerase domain-containing protein [Geobacterales bacterium]|nr:DNA polymerase domain-containing protein [Geobacterales bacterium]